MPAKLFKTATKQLHDGYKAARDRLSASSTGSGSRQNSFSSRGNISGNTSFNSLSSDSKQRSKISTLHEACADLDSTVDDATAKKNFCSNTINENKSYDRRYATPPRARSSTSIFRDMYHSPDVIRATQEASKSTPTFPSLPSGLSAFLSPKSAESTPSRTLAHIAGMFSFKRSFDSQVSDSQSSLDNVDQTDRATKG
jgi:hypothetical protein